MINKRFQTIPIPASILYLLLGKSEVEAKPERLVMWVRGNFIMRFVALEEQLNDIFDKLKTLEKVAENHRERINRCAGVENQLFAMYNGKLPLPTKEECLEMANKLGKRDETD